MVFGGGGGLYSRESRGAAQHAIRATPAEVVVVVVVLGIRFTHNARSADPFKSRADERSSLPRMETSLRSISGCRGRRHCGRWCRADRFSCNIRCDRCSSRSVVHQQAQQLRAASRSISGCRVRRQCGTRRSVDRFSCNIGRVRRSSRSKPRRVAVWCISRRSSYGQHQGNVGHFGALRLQNNLLQQQRRQQQPPTQAAWRRQHQHQK